MVRLNWGAQGSRFYETGIDRGVVFIKEETGAAWHGLVSVKEDPGGADPTPYYIDGVKYLNVFSGEEFSAKIEAFSAPTEFRVCDGTRSIHQGLIATQQPRVPFNFTYRTRLGNDLEGDEYAYKTHLVYNAVASPSEVSRGTVSSTPSPIIFNWPISTVPVRSSSFRPTSHFVIDSRFTHKNLLSNIEDILYGTDLSPSRMPGIDEIISMFDAYVGVYEGGGYGVDPYGVGPYGI